jgi:acyl-CoA reductase-like NAD-dependent aldehyde dehydrogenase
MLAEFNDGRSKSYYCIAATVLEINELHQALRAAKERTKDVALKEKAKTLHSILDQIAKEKGYLLKLRK